jgi:outer membrane protein OmpA-like peptidoglycan-associated protein
LHGLQDWEKAISAYKTYLRLASDKHLLRENAADNIRRCVAAQHIPKNEAIALVENLGSLINTPGDEFAPLPSLNHTDRLYFSAARAGSIGGKRDDRGYEDPARGHWCSDMLSALRRTSGWETAGNLGSLLNTSRHEIALGFNDNGQILYFFRGFTQYAGEILADTAARKDEYAIVQPAFKSPMEPEKGDGSPFFYNDSTIIFSSRRSGGQGGLDLWLTRRKNGEWTVPENLGPEINSSYDEITPFLARDGHTLHFSSNRNSSMGGHDVFRSVFEDKKMSWQMPQNVGSPINSPGDDTWFQLTRDGQSAFFCSDRIVDNLGQRDLYVAYFKDTQTEQLVQGTSVFFADAAQKAAQMAQNEIRRVTIPTLLYETDADLLNPENQRIMAEVAAVGKQLPQANLVLTIHSNESGPLKFDLYNGIKRAESVAKKLNQMGLPADKMILRSCAAEYPLARTIVEGQPNPAALRLNSRVECRFQTLAPPLPMEIRLERPVVSELMATNAINILDGADQSLSFRVEIANTRQILNDDALAMFSQLMIESQSLSGNYINTAGLFSDYAAAAQLCAELKKAGYAEAKVNAYINGIFIPRAEAVALLKKYPGLSGYIRG